MEVAAATAEAVGMVVVVGMGAAAGMAAAGMVAVGVGAGTEAGGMEGVGGPDMAGAAVTGAVILIGAILIGAGAAVTVTGVAATVGAAVGVGVVEAAGVVEAVGAAVTGAAGMAVTGASRIGRLPKNLCSGFRYPVRLPVALPSIARTSTADDESKLFLSHRGPPLNRKGVIQQLCLLAVFKWVNETQYLNSRPLPS